MQNKHLAGGVVLTWERLSVPFCDITEGLAVHFTTDIIVCGAGNVDFTISIVVHQLPPSDLHTGTLKKKKKKSTDPRAGWPFVLISFLLSSAKQSICIPLFSRPLFLC